MSAVLSMHRQTTEEWRRRTEEVGGENKVEEEGGGGGWKKEGRGVDASTGGCLQNIGQDENWITSWYFNYSITGSFTQA